jgi:diaminohydroxyphosphoribosylaminopyrimidine deaminase / 5-amino-6-(5-phosphoribosylamino)uracil reductase
MTVNSKNSTLNTRHVANMQAALNLARAGLGSTAENPSVGCVIVDSNGRIAGSARTANGGRPHAEVLALAQAGDTAGSGTAYVTLEPCSHHGKTGPCCDALMNAGVSSVYVATLDTDPRVSGRGIESLQAAGISVHVGLCEESAREVNRGFLSRIERSRPFVTLKSASSVDGRTALASGESKWITGAESRAYGHRLRAENDAILVGIGTVLADDPSLDCRLSGLEQQSPLPVVLDKTGQVPKTAKLVMNSNDRPLLVITGSDIDLTWSEQLVSQGVEVSTSSQHNQVFDLENVLGLLADKGINSLLVEGGGQTHAAFLRAGLVDEVYWFTAPKFIGEEGKPAVGGLTIETMADLVSFEITDVQTLGQDSLHILRKKEN